MAAGQLPVKAIYLKGKDGKLIRIAAAGSGTRLNGYYRTFSGVGSAGSGVVVVAAWKGLEFRNDSSLDSAKSLPHTGLMAIQYTHH